MSRWAGLRRCRRLILYLSVFAIISSLCLLLILHTKIYLSWGMSKELTIVYLNIGNTGSSVFSSFFKFYGDTHRSSRTLAGEVGNTRPQNTGLDWELSLNPTLFLKVSTLPYHSSQTIFYKRLAERNTNYKVITSIQHPVQWFVSTVESSPTYRLLGVNAKEVLASGKLFFNQTPPSSQLDQWVRDIFLQQLGFHMSPNYSRNESAILDYIQHADGRLQLVMLEEYTDESLVLLRRLMNWSMIDIFYIHNDESQYKHGVVLSEREEDILLDSSHYKRDWLMYQYFNRTFWRKISEHADFYDEVGEFRRWNTIVADFCKSPESEEVIGHTLHFSTSWEEDVIVDNSRCNTLRRQLAIGNTDWQK